MQYSTKPARLDAMQHFLADCSLGRDVALAAVVSLRTGSNSAGQNASRSAMQHGMADCRLVRDEAVCRTAGMHAMKQ